MRNKNPDIDLQSFLKLSHPANPKIPFLIEGLELKNTKKYGRGIYTSIDLKAGDVIAIEKPAMVFMCEEGQYMRCSKCFKVSMLNLIPCSKTGKKIVCYFISGNL